MQREGGEQESKAPREVESEMSPDEEENERKTNKPSSGTRAGGINEIIKVTRQESTTMTTTKTTTIDADDNESGSSSVRQEKLEMLQEKLEPPPLSSAQSLLSIEQDEDHLEERRSAAAATSAAVISDERTGDRDASALAEIVRDNQTNQQAGAAAGEDLLPNASRELDGAELERQQQQPQPQPQRNKQHSAVNTSNSLTSLFAHVNKVKADIEQELAKFDGHTLRGPTNSILASMFPAAPQTSHLASSMRKLSFSLKSDGGSSVASSSLTPQSSLRGDDYADFMDEQQDYEQQIKSIVSHSSKKNLSPNPETLAKLQQLIRKREELKTIDKQLFGLISQYLVELETPLPTAAIVDSACCLKSSPFSWPASGGGELGIMQQAQQQAIDLSKQQPQQAPTNNRPSFNLKKSRLLGSRQYSVDVAEPPSADNGANDAYHRMNLLNKTSLLPAIMEQRQRQLDQTLDLATRGAMQTLAEQQEEKTSHEQQQQAKKFKSSPSPPPMAIASPTEITYQPAPPIYDQQQSRQDVNLLNALPLNPGTSLGLVNAAWLRYQQEQQRRQSFELEAFGNQGQPNHSNGCSPMLTPASSFELHQQPASEPNPFAAFNQAATASFLLANKYHQQGYPTSDAYHSNQQQPQHTLTITPAPHLANGSGGQQQQQRRPNDFINCHQQLSKANLINLVISPEILQKTSAFKCHVCHSGFEDRHRLQQHLSIHLNLNPSWFEEKTIKETMAQYELKRGDYLCKVCKLRFETTSEFDKHMQLHGDKPHYCELCSKDQQKLISFRYYRQLLTHLRSHCFLYSCKFTEDCKQTANRKDYLKLHILKHHLNNRLPEQYTICCH